MISKELITQAIRMYPQYSQDDECTGNIQYKSGSNVVHFEMNGRSMQQINTYELAHKCKELAFHKGYEIIETDFVISIRKKGDRYSLKVYEYTEEEQNEQNVFKPEYTFKSCQWILDNKENQC